MKAPLAAALLLALAPALAAQEPPLAETGTSSEMRPPASSLELSAALGPSLVFGDPANPEFSESVGRVGVELAAAVAYRSSYFVDPQLEVGYAWLAHGRSELPSGPWGDGGTLKQQLGAWVISPGISADIWRFRPRIGIGLSIVSQSNEFAGETHSATQLSLLSQAGLGFQLFESNSLRIDADAKIVGIPGAELTFSSVGVVARWDALSFR
ncbi:MAG TPA: hypothetical protein VFS67_16760 [Polyangiaceae bacterium]|jgi:hypothetical protein|nr:hypothetical protein [Polyangiaceae bacterium]